MAPVSSAKTSLKLTLFSAVISIAVSIILLQTWSYSFSSSRSVATLCFYDYLSELFPNFTAIGDEFNQADGHKNARWQPIGANQSYVYSGYIDDRRTQDVFNTRLPVARLFAIFPRKEKVVNVWRCLFWYSDASITPAEVKVSSWTNLNTFDKSSDGTAYAMVLCPVPYYNGKNRQHLFLCDDSASRWFAHAQINGKSVTGCLKSGLAPIAVSLVPQSCSKPSNLVWLVDLPSRRRRHQSSDVVNRTQFSVCVPPVFGNNPRLHIDFVEFIEVNRMLGAQRFFFYVETTQAEFLSCLMKYRSKYAGNVSTKDSLVIEWTPWNLNEELLSLMYYHGQFIAINECIFRLLYLVDYIVSKDLDEFIVPTYAENWSQMLEKIPCKQESVASYSFRNQFIATNSPENEQLNSSVRSAGYTSVLKHQFRTLRFSSAENYQYPWTHRSKIIARPDRIFLWHVHEILDSSIIDRRAHSNCYVDGEHALLYHYTTINLNTSVSATRIVQHFLSPVMRRLKDASHMCLGG